jgi:hypothetical protein
MNEREWVETVKTDIEASLAGKGITVQTGYRLPYAREVFSYQSNSNEPALEQSHRYQTDLLISEQLAGTDDWAPRVVVEFKLGSVTSHDALTYSAKAATHKTVHPYLRYGIVIGGFQGPVPQRLMRHGQQFDFMVTLASRVLTPEDRERLVSLLSDELKAAQTMSKLVSEKSHIWLLHRKLEVRSS